MNKKYSILIFTFLFVKYNASAQSLPMYSQYMYSMTNINPAYAGVRNEPSLTALWREQWVGLPGAPTTKTISYDFATLNNKMGLGVQLFDDRYVNNIKRTGLNFMYNIKIRLSDKGMLSGGMKLGFYNDSKIFTSYYSGEYGTPAVDQAIANNLNRIVPLTGIGLFYYTDKFYVGFSAPDLVVFSSVAKYAADKSLYQINDVHYFLTAGYSYDINEEVNIKPSFLVKAVTGAKLQYDLNTNVWLKNLVGLGISYRVNQTVLAMAEVQATPQLRVGYAYDMPQRIPNSHELFLRYEFGRLFPKFNTYKID